ncbi:MAG: hypothetical protein AAF288_09445 [Planctomycetota bacterium]
MPNAAQSSEPDKPDVPDATTPTPGGPTNTDATAPTTPPRAASTYGRARLYLGMTGVGILVVLATAGLALGWPARWTPTQPVGLVQSLGVFAIFALIYTAVQAPLDLLGGYLLPKRHGRSHPDPPAFAIRWLRGAAVYGVVLTASLGVLSLGANVAGLLGVIGACLILMLTMLTLRWPLARLVAPLKTTPSIDEPASHPPTRWIEAPDEGFTGGLLGVLRPRRSLLPTHWRTELGEDGVSLAQKRRKLAASTNRFLTGRLGAVAFTLAGATLSGLLVGGPALPTPAGVIELSLWFTLWSFLGLLVLPTFSRKAVMALDAELRAAATHGEDATLTRAIQAQDRLQDDEPRRPRIVETIFHPIPSTSRRAGALTAKRRPTALGCFWDIARTAVFLSPAGGGLLGRAVHCNCGRPALWVYLPVE